MLGVVKSKVEENEMKNTKKAIIYYDENNTAIRVLDIKEFSISEFVNAKNSCEQNLKAKLEKEREEKEKLECILNELFTRLKIVELELAFNRGDIDEETYLKEKEQYGLE